MTVKEFDNLLSAAKRGKKIVRKIKYVDVSEDVPKETVLYTDYVNFLDLQMDEIVSSGIFHTKSSDNCVGQMTVFEIEEDTPSNNECPTWCDYNVGGECRYYGTDANECPKS